MAAACPTISTWRRPFRSKCTSAIATPAFRSTRSRPSRRAIRTCRSTFMQPGTGSATVTDPAISTSKPAPRPRPGRWTSSANTLADLDLAAHRAYLEAAMQAVRAAPLARRKALLAAMLIDAQVDRLFAAGGRGDDILAYRATMAARSPALGHILALCGQGGDTALVIDTVAVPLADYGRLAIEDFMVSLYNDHSVQRLRLVTADGERHDMLDSLTGAIAALDDGI